MKRLYRYYEKWIHGVILALIPIIACLISTLADGRGIGSIWLGACEWNDELFYFKQVECMVKNTIPYGFFGYNESCAQMLSFGAWSPVLLMPWAIWGKIFGWTYMSPIIANIFFMTLAMFVFGRFANIDLKQIIVIALAFLCIHPVSRYMLSGMPEIICLSLVIALLGMAIGYKESDHKELRIAVMLVAVSILTLMRPYFIVFYILPFMIPGRSGKASKLFTIVSAVTVTYVYFVMSSYLNAPYFGDVYSFRWIEDFRTGGFSEGLLNFVSSLVTYIIDAVKASIGGVRGGYPLGIYFGAFGFVMIILFCEGVMHDDKQKLHTHTWCLFACELAMFTAIGLMYSITDGFRHLLVFICAGVFVFMLTDSKYFIKESLCLLVLVWLFVIKAKDPLYFGNVYDSSDAIAPKAQVVSLRKDLESKMTSTNEMSWDNDVAIVFMDCRDEAEDDSLTTWQYAYALPKGFAVSLCTKDYTIEHISDMKSKYIFTMKGGKVEELLVMEGASLIYANNEISIYKMR